MKKVISGFQLILGAWISLNFYWNGHSSCVLFLVSFFLHFPRCFLFFLHSLVVIKAFHKHSFNGALTVFLHFHFPLSKYSRCCWRYYLVVKEVILSKSTTFPMFELSMYLLPILSIICLWCWHLRMFPINEYIRLVFWLRKNYVWKRNLHNLDTFALEN